MSNNVKNIVSLAIELMNKAMEDQSTFEVLEKKFESVQGLRPWKNAVYFRQPMTFEDAIVSYAALAWYHGGAEVVEGSEMSNKNTYVVFSKGYYEYCGA